MNHTPSRLREEFQKFCIEKDLSYQDALLGFQFAIEKAAKEVKSDAQPWAYERLRQLGESLK